MRDWKHVPAPLARMTAIVLLGTGLAGCDTPADDVGDTAGSTPDQQQPAAAAAQTQAPQSTAVAGLSSGWNTIEGGGDTVCSNGSDYQFFVRPGNPEKLVVYFQGGGACWFGRNCDLHLDPSYKPTVEDDELARYRGIFEFDNPDNPFADYSFVVAPYCSGDVHIGDNVATYQAPAREATTGEDGEPRQAHEAHELTIHHKGIVNAQAVLEWTYEHFTDPAEIFVTGSSAGAIPSPYYAWKIAGHYPDAQIAQLGDAAGGYRRSEDVNLARMEQWGSMDHFEQYPEFADMPPEDFRYEDLYIVAAKRYPNILFAEYDAAEDAVQKRFLAMGGRDTPSLRELLLANHADIRAEVDNFRAYVAGGDSHTVLARPEFYTFQVGGRRIRDWVADLAAFEDVENVTCEKCDEPELVEPAEAPEGAPPEGGQ